MFLLICLTEYPDPNIPSISFPILANGNSRSGHFGYIYFILFNGNSGSVYSMYFFSFGERTFRIPTFYGFWILVNGSFGIFFEFFYRKFRIGILWVHFLNFAERKFTVQTFLVIFFLFCSTEILDLYIPGNFFIFWSTEIRGIFFEFWSMEFSNVSFHLITGFSESVCF